MPLPLIIPVIALGAGYFGLRKSADGSDNAPDAAASTDDVGPTVASQFDDAIASQAAAEGVPYAFAKAWMAKESGGNPCAFGSAKAFGPDGNPREMGLGQLYNPDDFDALGIDSAGYRAYCTVGTQTQSRSLTPDEESEQVRGLIGIITRCRTAARKYNPGDWSEDSADFWRLVKLNHALPGLLHGQSQVTAYLGRPAASWAEFRETVGQVQLDHGTMVYSDSFDKLLNNAESTGGVV